MIGSGKKAPIPSQDTKNVDPNRTVPEESNDHFSNMFSRHQAVMLLIDPENGLIVDANEAAVAFYGYSREQLLRQYIHDINLLSAEQVRNEMENAVKEYRNYFVFPHSLADGQVRWVEVYSSPVEVSGKTLLFSIIHDISARKQAEEALIQSEDKFRLAFQTSPDSININRMTDGLYVDINQGFTDLTGYRREDVIGRTALDINIWQDPADRERLVQRLQERGSWDNMEAKFRRKDGTVGSALMSAKVFFLQDIPHILSITRDISEFKKAEQTLRESEERYRNILESIEEGYYEVDLAGNLVFFNDSACAMSGYSREELQGLTYRQFTDAENSKALFQVFNEVYKNGDPVNGFEWQVIRKDGTKGFGEASISLLKDPEGKPVGFRGIVRDVTQRKSAEEEKEKLQVRLQQSQRLESIGTLAGGIAHDFNNILMGVQGRISLMLLDAVPSDPNFEHLKGIEEYVRSAADLTKQLLGFARGGKYEVEATDLNRLAEENAVLFGRTRKEIAIHRRLQPDLWTAEVDRSQIEQVLLNLFVNAWQAMPTGGEIYLVTENKVLDREYAERQHVTPGRYARISISDTGVGMDAATQQRIFDPFFTTKEMGRGTGLGLASVYGIVKNHKGFIMVYSEKGYGSTFSIYLPASEREIRKVEKPLGDLLIREGLILLVDDEQIILDVGKPGLERLGYEVLIAKNGKEAIEIYRKNKDLIKLVILDMIMPHLSGEETFNQLKSINPEVRVLLASGYSINYQTQEILNGGCSGFIQKPFSLKELSQKVGDILDKE